MTTEDLASRTCLARLVDRRISALARVYYMPRQNLVLLADSYYLYTQNKHYSKLMYFLKYVNVFLKAGKFD